jgi:type I restriction enzyme S subunit
MKPGYKQTEVGVIPEDWEAKSLGSILTMGRLGGNYANQDAEAELPLMKMGNLARGHFDLSKVQFITSGVRPEAVHQLIDGDILFNTRNTLDLVGKVAIWRDELPVAYYNSNLMRLEFDPEQVCSNEYANYALNTESVVSRLRALATGTTSVAAIYTRDLMKLQVPVPPLPEQRAIAGALSDVDALLGAQEALLAKKRDLKAAAMQQLLTGETRLPSFSGEWEVKRLGEVATLKNGYAFKSETYTPIGAFKVITIANVQDGAMTTDGCNLIQAEPDDLQLHQRLSIGDILISMTGNVGRICKVSETACLLNQRVGKLLPMTINRDFLFITLRQSKFLSTMIGTAKGGAQPNLSSADIVNYSFNIPIDPAEQTAIAAVLSDMDAEIVALEAQRDKTRALKRGMMQELLTGRTRLL